MNSSERVRCWPQCLAEVVGEGQPNKGLRVVVLERDFGSEVHFGEPCWLVQPLAPARVYRWPGGVAPHQTCKALPCADSALRPVEPRPVATVAAVADRVLA